MSADTAVLVLWGIGLLAALGLTGVVLKLLFLLLRTLKDLRELAEWTAEAAHGLARVFTGAVGIEEAAQAAEGLRTGSAALQASAGRVRNAVNGPRRDGAKDRQNETQIEGAAGAGELGGAAGGPPSGPEGPGGQG